jgi:ribulose-phosphate 3-epimerase
MFGSYPGALLPGLHVVEGGQTSTGSAVAWLRGQVLNAGVGFEAGAADDAKADEEEATNKKRARPPPSKKPEGGLSYAQLDAQAALLPPGSEGLLALDHYQGNRTPHTDAKSRGAFVGLTLAHTPAHLHRALLEGVCFGTEAVLDAMKGAGFSPRRLFVAGGATRSPLWLQMHADVSNLPLSVPRGAGDAPALGCAILAAAAAGFHGGDVRRAAEAMVSVERTVEPDQAAAAAYAPAYRRWKGLYPALKATFHYSEAEEEGKAKAAAPPPPLVPAPTAAGERKPPSSSAVAIAPSLLAADLSDLPSELSRLGDSGANSWLHYDCFDGSLGTQITFGAPLLGKLRQRTSRGLDVHLIAHDPQQHLSALKQAGADAVTVQYENVVAGGDEQEQQKQKLAALLEEAKQQLGFAQVGLALALGTPADAARPFLPLVDRVLVMAVPLGYGGQPFERDESLAKIRALRAMAAGEGLSVGVDGGIGEQEAEACAQAGADFIVAGSSVFRAKHGATPAEAERALLRAAQKGARLQPKSE